MLSVRDRVASPRMVAALLTCSLASITLLAYPAGPPTLSIPQLSAVEDGTEVTVSGILVEHWMYEGGSEGMVLTDPDCRAQVKVVCSGGSSVPPSGYATPGDELEVTGEVSSSRGTPVVYTSSDRVLLLRQSQEVVTVRMLSECWQLFNGDTVEVKGVIIPDHVVGGTRIQDLDGSCSLGLDADSLPLDQFIGCELVVVGTVFFDFDSGTLIVSVEDLGLP